ncbi:MAG TPA: cell division protein FtsA [Methylomirabilota bacterium]|nr:cell division protein FtsA [Methylomirabilota bacterium]
MFDSDSTIVGLEIGTTKICAVVGAVNDAGGLNIVGIGQAKSRGVRKGEIVDASLVQEDVRAAIVEAEQMADAEIRSVYLSVTGNHVKSFNNRGFHPIVSHDRAICEEDVQDVIKNAKAITLPAENRVLHMIRQQFLVDGHPGITNPVGMMGAKFEVDMHVIHGNYNRLTSMIRAVKALQLDVHNVVFSGLAASLALLENEHKELGALVIDMGAGTTDYVVYSGGLIKHSGSLAVGGDHVSNDLAYGLKVPLSRAEKLKLDHGAAVALELGQTKSITLPSEVGLPDRVLNLVHLQEIMSARLEETLEIIAHDLHQCGLLDSLGAGVFLCGGGARIPHIDRLASDVFNATVTVGKTNSVSGARSALDQPEFATAIGLARFGYLENRRKFEEKTGSGLRGAISQLFRRA